MEGGYCQNRLKRTSRSPLYKSDIKFLVCRKLKRNRRRILRRKRSKLNYWNHRKQLKLSKHNQSLCDTISVCSITDMDYQNEFHGLSVQPIPEVADWHKQSQIAYWKSRALALELENNMLHKHIAHMYAKQTQEYADYDDNDEYYDRQQRKQNWSKKEVEHKNSDDTGNDGGEDGCSRQRKGNSSRQRIWKAPEENARKRKLEEMKTLYGGMAPKILGMETAMQLNYDLYLEKHNAKYWPNIPLRL